MQSSGRITQLVLRTWNRTILPVAQWLDNWQSKVSIKTRNWWVLSIIGTLFIYGLFSLITLFF